MKNFADLFLEDQNLPFSQLELSPIPLEFDSSNDSGLGSLDGTVFSFIHDSINSPIQTHETTDCSSSRLLYGSISNPPADKSPALFSSGSPVAKQLLFDSSSSPSSSPEAASLKPRRIFFEDSLETSCAVYDAISEVVPPKRKRVLGHHEADIVCASPTFSRKEKSRQQNYATIGPANQAQGSENKSAFPVTQTNIKTAFHEEESNSDLVGDFSRKHHLPTVPGKHQDLRSITADTLAELLTGIQVPDADYKIIDCRYPYEYDGGHIDGAVNIHTKEHIQSFMEQSVCSAESRYTMLIFYCEFSSQRGPRSARFLRNLDRQMNAQHYPHLTFPEVYILDGGYREFFYQYRDLSNPENYTPMLHRKYKNELKKYRSKSKSWKANKKSTAAKFKSQFKP